MTNSKRAFQEAIRGALRYAKTRAHTSDYARDIVEWAVKEERTAQAEGRDWMDDWDIGHAKQLADQISQHDTQRDGGVIAEGLMASVQDYSLDTTGVGAYSKSELNMGYTQSSFRNSVSTSNMSSKFTSTSAKETFSGDNYTTYSDESGNSLTITSNTDSSTQE